MKTPNLRSLMITTLAKRRVIALLLPFLALTAFTSRASLILNGSFESPQITANSFSATTPTSWTGGAFLFNGNVGAWPGPEDGQQFEDIGFSSTPALSQTVTVGTPGLYLLEWHDNTYTVPGSIYHYSVLVTGNTTTFYTGSGSVNWGSRSLLLNLAGGANTISFQGGSGNDGLIDNVSLIAVPEPTTTLAGGLLLLPLGISAIRKRFRGRTQHLIPAFPNT